MESADEKKGCCGPGEACSAPDCTGTPLTIDGDRRVESEESMAEAEVPPSHPTLDEVVEADLPVMAASGEIPDFAHADDFGAVEESPASGFEPGEFHHRDDWFFRAEPDGSVRIRTPGGIHVIDPGSWVSIVGHVSPGRGSAEAFAAADRLHTGKIPEASSAKSELQEAQETLGIGGCIEVGPHDFRVKAVNAGNPRYGHGKTIEAAMYDLNHPGQLKPTVGE